MNTNYDYICDACQKQFHTDYGVREHYYQEHKKEHLYFCTRCGKGFFHKSHKSNHKKICPKKGQEEKFDPCAPVDEELELTFKRRQRVPLDIPPAVREIAESEEAECRAAESALAKISEEPEKDDE